MLAAACATLAAACGPTVATRGNLVPAERLAQIQPGISTADDVAATLGTPTTVATFNDRTWYYIGQRTEKTAFFDPAIVDRQVVQVTFDETGLVNAVEELDLDDAQEVAFVGRETPTLGRRITFLEQMLGNFGRGFGDTEQEDNRRSRLPGETR